MQLRRLFSIVALAALAVMPAAAGAQVVTGVAVSKDTLVSNFVTLTQVTIRQAQPISVVLSPPVTFTLWRVIDDSSANAPAGTKKLAQFTADGRVGLIVGEETCYFWRAVTAFGIEVPGIKVTNTTITPLTSPNQQSNATPAAAPIKIGGNPGCPDTTVAISRMSAPFPAPIPGASVYPPLLENPR